MTNGINEKRRSFRQEISALIAIDMDDSHVQIMPSEGKVDIQLLAMSTQGNDGP